MRRAPNASAPSPWFRRLVRAVGVGRADVLARATSRTFSEPASHLGLERTDLAEALGAALRRAADGGPALHYRVTGTPRRLAPETERIASTPGAGTTVSVLAHERSPKREQAGRLH